MAYLIVTVHPPVSTGSSGPAPGLGAGIITGCRGQVQPRLGELPAQTDRQIQKQKITTEGPPRVCTHTQATLSGSLKNDFFLWVHRFAGKVRLFRRHGRGARTGSAPPEVAREQEHRGWLCVLGAASHPADTERVVSQGTQTAAAQGGFLFHAVGERWPKR